MTKYSLSNSFGLPLILFSPLLILLSQQVPSLGLKFDGYGEFTSQIKEEYGSFSLILVQFLLVASVIQIIIIIYRLGKRFLSQGFLKAIFTTTFEVRIIYSVPLALLVLKLLYTLVICTISFVLSHYILSTLVLIYLWRKRKSFKDSYLYQDSSQIYGDDVTKLNSTRLDKVFFVRNVKDIQYVIKEAKRNGKHVTIRGQHHTMGGHTLSQNAYLIDMKYMTKMTYNKKDSTLVTEPGVTWGDVVRLLNTYGAAPKIMQSYCSFSVGGTIAVNAHGITSDYAMYDSVISLKVVTADGELLECDREKNSELFSSVIGGFGLFGVIYEVTLQTVPNVKISMESIKVSVSDFKKFYSQFIESDSIEVKIARIDITNFKEIFVYLFSKESSNSTVSSLTETERTMSFSSQMMYKWVTNTKYFQRFRFALESFFETPLDWAATQTDRNLLIYESAKPMYELYSPLIEIDDTFVLQEFFIPHDNFDVWLEKLLAFTQSNFKHTSLMNITIRYVKKDSTSSLPYAQTDVFAFVLYYRIKRTKEGDEELAWIHSKIMEAALPLNGTFYLPYRHHYTDEDLKKSYPMIDSFFEKKLKYDPDQVFSNLWYQRYGKKYSKPCKISTDIQIEKIEVTERVPVVESHRFNSYHKVFSSEVLKKKFDQFLNHVFTIEDPKWLFGVIAKAVWKQANKDDLAVYEEIQDKLKNRSFISGIKASYATLQQLFAQKTEFMSEYYSLLSKIGRLGTLDNFVSVGDSGKLVKEFREILGVNGEVYILNDKQSPLDYVERGSFFNQGKFVEFHLDSIKDNYPIPEDSIDILTINQGLHHIPLTELPKFLKFVWKVLRDNGILVIREHDATEELMPLVDIAHSTFNAVTGVSLIDEKNEVRCFRTVDEWRQLLSGFGFQDTYVTELQGDDSTADFMIAFTKPPKIDKEIKPSLLQEKPELDMKIIKEDMEKRGVKLTKSNPSSCFFRLPEWLLVRVTESFAQWMNKEVFYKFPFIDFIVMFWTIFINEGKVVASRYGYYELYSYGVIMNMIIGVILTVGFGQMWLVCLPLRFADYLLTYEGDESEQILIHSKSELDFAKIDDRIKKITDSPQQNGTIYLVQTPRHIPFNEIIEKLSKIDDCHVMEIGGNAKNQIQIELIADNKLVLSELTECEILFEFKYPIKDEGIHVSVGVENSNILNFLRRMREIKGVRVKQIYDYLFK